MNVGNVEDLKPYVLWLTVLFSMRDGAVNGKT